MYYIYQIPQSRQKDDLRRSQSNQQKCEIHGVEQHSHGLVPAEHDKYAVHPIRNLRNAGHGASLRLNIVSVSITSELVGQLQGFRFSEHVEGGREVKFFGGVQRVTGLRWESVFERGIGWRDF